MDISQALVTHELLRLFIGLVPDRAVQDHFGAVTARGRDLRRRRVFRHAHHGADTMELGCQGDALCMVAGRGADDATPFLFLWHERELVQRPADLVRTDALEHLRLEADVEPRPLTQLSRREQRSALYVGGDSGTRRLEVFRRESEHQDLGTCDGWTGI